MSVDYEAFVEAVRKMRQRDYFKTRDTHILHESKRAEKKVDALLQEMAEPQETLAL